MSLRVLVVESRPEDVIFLRDVLTELDGAEYWSQWTSVSPLFASSWSEAAGVLTREPIDVVLLNLDLCDSQGAETFRRSQAIAPLTPVVLLIDPSTAGLAERLLREGAQDYLIRNEVDCMPLARAVSNAIGRHRLMSAMHVNSMVDQLTGLLSRTAFLLLAERDRLLAERLDRRMVVIVGQVKELAALTAAHGEQRRDLELVAAADFLRSLAGPVDLIGRISDDVLAMNVLEFGQDSAEETWARLHSAAADRRISFGAAVFDPQDPEPLDRLLDQARRDLMPKGVGA